MYCSSCGAAITQGLRFCNHCGKKIAPSDPNELSSVRPQLLVSAMAGTFVLGLPGISLLVLLLSNGAHLGQAQVMGFAAFASLLMLLIEAVYIVLLFRSTRRVNEERDTKELPLANKELMDRSFGESLPSVTEHTTRAFDPAYPDQPKR